MNSSQLKKNSLGLWSLVFFVVAAASPLTGVVGGLPVAISAGNGAGIPAVYIMAGAILLVFSFGYIAMSRYVTNAGAFYSYITLGLGRRTGISALAVALLAYFAIQIAVVAMFGFFSSMYLHEHFGVDLPWWLYSLVMLLVVCLLGIESVEIGGRVLGILMLMEVGIVLLTDAAVVWSHGTTPLTLTAFTPTVIYQGSIGIALVFSIAAFIGFESTAIYGEECRDPAKTVPRATLMAVVLIMLFFAVTSWAMVQVYGVEQVREQAVNNPGRFIFDVATRLLGGWSEQVMSLLLITSLFAATQAFHNTISRYLFSISRDGFLWSKLARVRGGKGTPYIASLVQTGLMAALLLAMVAADLDPMMHIFALGSAMATMAILLLQVGVSLAVIRFFRREVQLPVSAWSRLWAPAISSVAMLAALIMVTSNLDILSGSSSGSVALIPWLVFGMAAVGYLSACRVGATPAKG
ncbi:APC family permease [Musicola paradisiaca]|uniref:Amino acid permease-associated region n=1 Tax=Musicola paradisiaca (strain Ech703) TaxID=579405 RepID=C6CDD1_MUSP7|nr:APC family permease [Musicola paradisiaca]ACS87002.1 amino acid permease-associated region [Musicola paradisiaca Ech703]